MYVYILLICSGCILIMYLCLFETRNFIMVGYICSLCGTIFGLIRKLGLRNNCISSVNNGNSIVFKRYPHGGGISGVQGYHIRVTRISYPGYEGIISL